MKDKKGINKGKEDQASENNEVKKMWQGLLIKLSGDKRLNQAIHSPDENYTIGRLKDFKDILSNQYTKMEDWINILETISKTFIVFIDDVAPQNHQSQYIKKILEKKELMTLETVNNFLDLMVDEGSTSEAGKVITKQEYSKFTNPTNKSKKQSPILDSCIQIIEDYKDRINTYEVVSAKYVEFSLIYKELLGDIDIIKKSYNYPNLKRKVPSESRFREALNAFEMR